MSERRRSFQEEIRDEFGGMNTRAAMRVESSVAWTVGRWLLLALLVLAPTLFIASQFGVFGYRFFGTQREAARHDIFKESQAYNDGAVKNLARLKLEYETADEAHKAALRSMILTEASVVDVNKLPGNLQAFIRQLERS